MPADVQLTADLRLGNQTTFERQIKELERKVAGSLRTGNSQPLGKISANISEFDKSLESANARVLAFGASASIIAGVGTAIKEMVSQTLKVEKSLLDINVLLNLSATSLSKFGTELFGIAKNTGQSFDEVAKAATEFSRQGLGVEDTLKRTQAALILTRLSGLDAAKSVETLTATINSFQKEALDANVIVNKLANVDAKFAVSSRDLAEGLSRAGSVAQDAGVSFDELVGSITAIQQRTARGGAVIGNSLKSIFTRISRPEVLDQLEQLGVGVRNTEGAVLPGIQVITNLAKSFDTLGEAQKSAIGEMVGGIYQIGQLKSLVADLASANSIAAAATRTSSAAQSEAIERNEALNKSLSAMGNAASVNFARLSSEFGKGLFGPSLEKVFSQFNDFSDNIDGEGAGEKIGRSLIAGIGNAIAGPGLVLGTFLGVKLLGQFASFAKDALGSLVGLGAESQRVQNLQKGIVSLLSQEPALQQQILSGVVSVAEAEQKVLALIEAQIAAKALLAETSRTLAVSTAERGATFNPFSGNFKTKNKAGGHVPISQIPQEAIQKEIVGASRAGYSIDAHNVRAMKANIDGRATTVVYNNREKVIHDFNGSGEPAIIPPNQTVRSMMNFAGGFNIDKSKVGGLIGSGGFRNVFEFGKNEVLSYPKTLEGVLKTYEAFHKRPLSENEILTLASHRERENSTRGALQQRLGETGLGPKVSQTFDNGAYIAEKINLPNLAKLRREGLIDAKTATKVIGRARNALEKAGFPNPDLNHANIVYDTKTKGFKVVDLAAGRIPLENFAGGFTSFGVSKVNTNGFKLNELGRSKEAFKSIGDFLKKNLGLKKDQLAPFSFEKFDDIATIGSQAAYYPGENKIKIFQDNIANQLIDKRYEGSRSTALANRPDFINALDGKLGRNIVHEGFHNGFAFKPEELSKKFALNADKNIFVPKNNKDGRKFLEGIYKGKPYADEALAGYKGYEMEEAMAIQFPKMLGFASGYLNAAGGIGGPTRIQLPSGINLQKLEQIKKTNPTLFERMKGLAIGGAMKVQGGLEAVEGIKLGGFPVGKIAVEGAKHFGDDILGGLFGFAGGHVPYENAAVGFNLAAMSKAELNALASELGITDPRLKKANAKDAGNIIRNSQRYRSFVKRDFKLNGGPAAQNVAASRTIRPFNDVLGIANPYSPSSSNPFNALPYRSPNEGARYNQALKVSELTNPSIGGPKILEGGRALTVREIESRNLEARVGQELKANRDAALAKRAARAARKNSAVGSFTPSQSRSGYITPGQASKIPGRDFLSVPLQERLDVFKASRALPPEVGGYVRASRTSFSGETSSLPVTPKGPSIFSRLGSLRSFKDKIGPNGEIISGQQRNQNFSSKALTGSFIAPFLGGALAEGFSESSPRVSRALKGASNSIGTGLAVGGLVGGPAGAAIGGLVGTFGALKAIIDNLNPSFEDLNEKIVKANEKTTTDIQGLSSVVSISDQIKNSNGLSKSQLNLLTKQRSSALGGLDQSEQKKIRDSNFDSEIINNILGEKTSTKAREDASAGLLTALEKAKKDFSKNNSFTDYIFGSSLTALTSEKSRGAISNSLSSSLDSNTLLDDTKVANALKTISSINAFAGSFKQDDKYISRDQAFSTISSSLEGLGLKNAGELNDQIKSVLSDDRNHVQQSLEEFKDIVSKSINIGQKNARENNKTDTKDKDIQARAIESYNTSLARQRQLLENISQINWAQTVSEAILNLRQSLENTSFDTKSSIIGNSVDANGDRITNFSKQAIDYSLQGEKLDRNFAQQQAKANLELRGQKASFVGEASGLANSIPALTGAFRGRDASTRIDRVSSIANRLAEATPDNFNIRDVVGLRNVLSQQLNTSDGGLSPEQTKNLVDARNQAETLIRNYQQMNNAAKLNVGAMEATYKASKESAAAQRDVARELEKQKQLASLFDFGKLITGQTDLSSIGKLAGAQAQGLSLGKNLRLGRDERVRTLDGRQSIKDEIQGIQIKGASSLKEQLEGGIIPKRDQIRAILKNRGSLLSETKFNSNQNLTSKFGDYNTYSNSVINNSSLGKTLSQTQNSLAIGYNAAGQKNITDQLKLDGGNFVSQFQKYDRRNLGRDFNRDFERRLASGDIAGARNSVSSLSSSSPEANASLSDFIKKLDNLQAYSENLPEQAKIKAQSDVGGSEYQPLDNKTFTGKMDVLITNFQVLTKTLKQSQVSPPNVNNEITIPVNVSVPVDGILTAINEQTNAFAKNLAEIVNRVLNLENKNSSDKAGIPPVPKNFPTTNL